jgi:hypothetical protein
LYQFLISPMRATCPALDLIIQIIFSEANKLRSSLCSLSHHNAHQMVR